eukprot:jgi/Mesen1/4446/ME000226S03380
MTQVSYAVHQMLALYPASLPSVQYVGRNQLRSCCFTPLNRTPKASLTVLPHIEKISSKSTDVFVGESLLSEKLSSRSSRRCCSIQSCQIAGDTGDVSEAGVESRRRILLGSMVAAATLIHSPHHSVASLIQGEQDGSAKEVPYGTQYDKLNALQYNFPLALPQGLPGLSWVETRRPERYSSAAPLAPDSRLRIVSERLDFKNSLVISTLIGPPNKAFLSSSQGVEQWNAANVAKSVLADKNSSRTTAAQRVQETIIGDTRKFEIDGQPYWYFEYLAQKSPTIYMEGVIQQALLSFRLLPPTSDYVPPWKDPWRFW